MNVLEYWAEYISGVLGIGVSVALQIVLQAWHHGFVWWIVAMSICFFFQIFTDRLAVRVLKSRRTRQ